MKGEANEQILKSYQMALAGATAGAMTRFVLQPFDVLKVRFQLQTASKMEEKKYISIPQAVRTVIREEGLQGLWKGHIPGQCLSVLYGGVQFSFYECSINYFKREIPNIYAQYEHMIRIGSGCAAGFLATVVSFPFDTVRTHLIFQTEPKVRKWLDKVYLGMFDAIRKIYSRDGPWGFTKGLAPACMSAAPVSGLVFYFHGIFSELWFLFLETRLDASSEPPNLSVTGNLITGLLAGLCAKTVVYPLDLMKKRLQIQNFEGKSGCYKITIKCSKISRCFALTLQNEGFLGLFKGYVPTVIKASATTSLYFTFYDKACQFLYHLEHKR